MIFQEYGVFPWLTVGDNIAFGLKLHANKKNEAQRRDICDRYLSLMRLSDFRNAFPKTLSGGMRQRVALARAYAVNPQFLLMDEPFGALDAQTRSAMQDLLLEVLATEGKTVVMITHSVDEALYLASRVIVVSARPARIRTVIDVPSPTVLNCCTRRRSLPSCARKSAIWSCRNTPRRSAKPSSRLSS